MTIAGAIKIGLRRFTNVISARIYFTFTLAFSLVHLSRCNRCCLCLLVRSWERLAPRLVAQVLGLLEHLLVEGLVGKGVKAAVAAAGGSAGRWRRR